jgi:hypothetical protein
VAHDYGGVTLMQADNLLTFGLGVARVIADFLTYMTCGALAQGVIRFISGPGKADSLARSVRPA